eukprot:g34343.t1
MTLLNKKKVLGRIRIIIKLSPWLIDVAPFLQYGPTPSLLRSHYELRKGFWTGEAGFEPVFPMSKRKEPDDSGAGAGPTTNEADQAKAAALKKRLEQEQPKPDKVGPSSTSDNGPATSGDGPAKPSKSSCPAVLAELPRCVLPEGRGKYVLVLAQDKKDSKLSQHFVRMDPQAAYHVEVAEPFTDLLKAVDKHNTLAITVLGGGRIEHNSKKKTISIYGFSYGFPWQPGASHAISHKLCVEAYPGYSVDWSDKGY